MEHVAALSLEQLTEKQNAVGTSLTKTASRFSASDDVIARHSVATCFSFRAVIFTEFGVCILKCQKEPCTDLSAFSKCFFFLQSSCVNAKNIKQLLFYVSSRGYKSLIPGRF